MICGRSLRVFAVAVFLVVCSAQAAVVGPEDSIQAAIDAAAPGEVIEVHGGIHHESLNLSRPVTLKGLDNPVVDGGMLENAITISAEGVVVDGFVVTNSTDSGIEVQGDGCTLTGNVVKDNRGVGISLHKCQWCNVTGNEVSDNEIGISLWFSHNNTLFANVLERDRCCIYQDFSDNNTLADNRASGFRGIYLFISDDNVIEDNRINSSKCGVDIQRSSGNIVSRNSVMDGEVGIGCYTYGVCDNVLTENVARNNTRGIVLQTCGSNVLRGNVVTENGEFGILLNDSGNNTLIDNVIENNTVHGLYITSRDSIWTYRPSGGNVLRGNIMAENGYDFGLDLDFGLEISHPEALNNDIDSTNLAGGKGICYLVGASDVVVGPSQNVYAVYCIDCRNVTVRDLVLDNVPCGVYFHNTTGSRIQNNTLVNVTNGIWLYSSHNNGIDENFVKGSLLSKSGIALFASKENSLSKNRVTNVSDTGISLTLSANNTMRGNVMAGNRYNLVAQGYNEIDTDNTVDEKPVYYMFGEEDLFLDEGADPGMIYCVNCRNITVGNLSLRNNGCGIYLLNTTASTLVNNSVVENYEGISLTQCSWINVEENNVSDNDGTGLSLSGTSNSTVSKNTVAGNIDGISLTSLTLTEDFSTALSLSEIFAPPTDHDGDQVYLPENNLIADNLVRDNSETGINVDSSVNNTIWENTVSGNLGGIEIGSSYANLVAKNVVENNSYGMQLAFSWDNVVADNVLRDCKGAGLDLMSSRYNQIWGNHASGNDIGIFMIGSRNNTFTRNNATDNRVGIMLVTSRNNTFRENLFGENLIDFKLFNPAPEELRNYIDTSNRVSGGAIYYLLDAADLVIDETSNAGMVYCVDSSNVTITNVTLGGNGLYLYNTTGSLIEGCNINDGDVGVYLKSSDQNAIFNNVIDNCSDRSIKMVKSADNLISGNCLGDVSDSGDGDISKGENRWYDGQVGNFYEGFTCSDANDDGICTSAYNISGADGVDRYPLVQCPR